MGVEIHAQFFHDFATGQNVLDLGLFDASVDDGLRDGVVQVDCNASRESQSHIDHDGRYGRWEQYSDLFFIEPFEAGLQDLAIDDAFEG